MPSSRLCYLSERVRRGRGGAVGGAKTKRKLPLVNKKSARRFRLWLQNTRWRKKKSKEMLNKKLHTDLNVRNLGVLDLYLSN